jgi:hypothetical protein
MAWVVERVKPMTDRDRRVRQLVDGYLAEWRAAGSVKSPEPHAVVGFVLGKFKTGIEPGLRDYQGMQAVADEVLRVLQERESATAC